MSKIEFDLTDLSKFLRSLADAIDYREGGNPMLEQAIPYSKIDTLGKWASVFGCSSNTLRKWIEEERIIAIGEGQSWRIRVDQFPPEYQERVSRHPRTLQ